MDEAAQLGTDALIEGWGLALEAKDPGTWTHCRRVAAIATVLANALKLDQEEGRAIACGALLHEIGKLEIPEAILRKPAVLTAEEKLVMREYCQRGYEIVRKASLEDVAEIVRSHRGVRAFADARAEIQHWSARLFDPRIVDVFLNIPDEDWQRATSSL